MRSPKPLPSAPASTSIVRKPVAPSGRNASPRCSATSYSTGSPCVCGHQRHTLGTATLARRRSGPARSSVAWCLPHDSRAASASGSGAANVSSASSQPVSPSMRACRSQSTSTGPSAGSSTSTGRHGPVGTCGGNQPGMCPNSDVRTVRSAAGSASRVRQRARRGARVSRRCAASARKQTVSRCVPSSDTETSCATNMLSERRIGVSSSHACASVARP